MVVAAGLIGQVGELRLLDLDLAGISRIGAEASGATLAEVVEGGADDGEADAAVPYRRSGTLRGLPAGHG